MFILTNPGTADKVQLVTSATCTVDVFVSWVDHTLSGDNVEAGRQATAISTAATTDICAGPASGVVRNVKQMFIRNRHATTSVDVTVLVDIAGTDYQVKATTLRAGEELHFTEGVGFYAYVGSSNPAVRAYKLASDHSDSTATPTEVSGLSNLTGTGTFAFNYYLIGNNAATTTGFKISVNHDGTVTQFVYTLRWLAPLSTASDDIATGAFTTAAGGVISGFAARAKTTTGTGIITDVDATNADVLMQIEGVMTVTVDGNIELWHGSDAAAAVSVLKAGSGLVIARLGD